MLPWQRVALSEAIDGWSASIALLAREPMHERLGRSIARKPHAGDRQCGRAESDEHDEIETDLEVRDCGDGWAGQARVLEEVDTVRVGIQCCDEPQNCRQLLHRIEGARQKEHGKDHQIHHGRVVLERARLCCYQHAEIRVSERRAEQPNR